MLATVRIFLGYESMSARAAKRWSVGLVVLSMAALLGPATADEIDDLKQALQEQKTRSAELENRINQLEARQRLKEQSLTQEIDKPAAPADEEKAEVEKPAGGLPDNLKWLEKIKISGDLRIRHEHIDSQTVNEDDSIGWRSGRDRLRMRARLMISAIINNEWDVAFRLATGQLGVLEEDLFPDPISANQTFTGFSSRKSLWIDLAYFDYHPEAVEGLHFIGGKMKHPFLKVGKNQLMYDNDLNLEGLAATYAVPLNEQTNAHISGGGFWIDESGSGVDTFLWGIQGHLKHAMSEPSYVLGGAGFYDYANIQGKSDEFGILFGNTPGPDDADGNPTWASDFDVLELFGEYGTQVGKLPVAVHGTWVLNTAAVDGQDTGWLVGGTLGKAKDPGSWQFGYNYRDLERDAVLAAWVDSDFAGGGTGARGHTVLLRYQVAKNVQAAFDYFHSTIWRSGPDLDFRRLHGGFVLKF